MLNIKVNDQKINLIIYHQYTISYLLYIFMTGFAIVRIHDTITLTKKKKKITYCSLSRYVNGYLEKLEV